MGSSISVGSFALITEIFSRTSWIARSMSRSNTNSTVTTDEPSVLVELIVFTPLIVFTDSSILSVTSISIISELAPFNRVVIFTIGRSTFGNRSTPILG